MEMVASVMSSIRKTTLWFNSTGRMRTVFPDPRPAIVEEVPLLCPRRGSVSV